MADLSLYQRMPGFDAYKQQGIDRNLNREMQKAQMQALEAKAQADLQGGSLPATIQIANEIDKALREGNKERANLLHQVHKTMDKGILPYGMGGFELPAQNVTGQVMGNQTQPGQFDALDAEMAQMGTPQAMPPSLPPVFQGMPTAQVGEVPGYSDLMAQREGKKAGASERAKLEQQLKLEPQIKRASAAAQEQGKSEGGTFAELQDRVSVMPQLVDTTRKLSALGKLATYTMGGQARDFLMRQTGMQVPDEAVARTEYISMVDNEILPLLRQTFGAQFTEREGQSLKATLGDPNKSPQEKDAVLRSFMGTKMKTINSQARRVGQPEPYTDDDIQSVVSSIGTPPTESQQSVKEGTTATNPQTGQRMIYADGQWRPL